VGIDAGVHSMYHGSSNSCLGFSHHIKDFMKILLFTRLRPWLMVFVHRVKSNILTADS